jgi:hypothetical protein
MLIVHNIKNKLRFLLFEMYTEFNLYSKIHVHLVQTAHSNLQCNAFRKETTANFPRQC